VPEEEEEDIPAVNKYIISNLGATTSWNPQGLSTACFTLLSKRWDKVECA
jgi:hypothetical protein